MSEGKILRSIPLDSVADALAIDPGEHRFYAGCRDGKIYIKSLNAENNPTIGILFDHRFLSSFHPQQFSVKLEPQVPRVEFFLYCIHLFLAVLGVSFRNLSSVGALGI